MTTGERLSAYLERFFALKQQSDDAVFLARLATLRQCQTNRLRRTHADLLAQPKLNPALEFILNDIYNAQDLLPVAKEIQRALSLALKLLPNSVMNTSADALETAVLTQELDEALVEQLGNKLDTPLSDNDYIVGYQQLGCEKERTRQLELVATFGTSLEKYVRSRLLQGTFKVVKKPAHKAGFSHLYSFMEHCFAVMKPVPNAEALLRQLAQRETQIKNNLLANAVNPFTLNK